jgi:hypothetical protein
MCGRARLSNDYSEIKIKLKIGNAVAPNLYPSWNIAPTQVMLCVTWDKESKQRIASRPLRSLPRSHDRAI